MAKFISIVVGTETRNFPAENFVSAERSSDTETIINYFGATVTLTHTDDTPGSGTPVRTTIQNAVVRAFQEIPKNIVTPVSLPTGITVSAAVTTVFIPAEA